MSSRFERVPPFQWPPAEDEDSRGRDGIHEGATMPVKGADTGRHREPQARWAMPTEEEMAWEEAQEAELDAAKLAWEPDDYDN